MAVMPKIVLTRKIEYCIQVADQMGLEYAVRELIEQGWVPLGGISLAKNSYGIGVFAQAMTRESLEP